MPEFGTDPAQAERAVQDWGESLQRKASQFTALRRRIDKVRATESSRAVTVTVNSDGVPVDVRFAEPSKAMPVAELSREFMSVLGRAQARIADLVAEATNATVGDQTSGNTLVDSYRQRFPTQAAPDARPASPGRATGPDAPRPAAQPTAPAPAPHERPPAPRPDTQRHGAHDDGDFSDETFLN